MQATRDTLEFLYYNVTTECGFLREMSGMPSTTFYRNYKILQQGGSLERKKGSGRPLKISGVERRRLTQLALRNPTFSTNNIAEIFCEKTGISVHGSTVHRSLKTAGITKKLPKIVPEMTQVHHEKRRNFARTWRNYHFRDVILSDECVFQLHRNKLQVWCKSSEKRPYKGAPKFCPKVMVWGALSFKGFYLKIIPEGTINSRKYCEILLEFMPYANALFANGWILEQDGATPHTSRETSDFFAENQVQILQWPPNSPDINPVENVWTILKNFVEKKNPQTKAALIENIQESQHEITESIRENLMKSIPKRLGLCLANNGEFVDV